MLVCLFDIDGTLLSSGGAGKAAMEAALGSEFGVSELRGRVLFSGRTDRAIGRDLFSLHDIEESPHHWDRFLTAYLGHLPDCLAKHDGRVLPGIARLLGPTGGYLLAYPVAAFAVGRVVGATDPGRKLGVARLSLAVFTGLVLIHLGGLAQLLILTGSATGALRLGTIPFLIGDLAKVAIAVLALKPTVSPLRARL